MNTRNETIPGLVQVYTGNGKGKTTAALGLALRASGWDKKVIFIQFLKGNADCGEHRFVNKYRPFEIVQPNSGDCFTRSREELEPFVAEAFARTVAAATNGDYDVVILDEVFHAVNGGYITTRALLDVIENKYQTTELVLTGRGAPPEIIEAADLVTEMQAVKHPFSKGVKSRKGIEY